MLIWGIADKFLRKLQKFIKFLKIVIFFIIFIKIQYKCFYEKGNINRIKLK